MNHDNEKNPRVDNTPENTEDVNAAAPAELLAGRASCRADGAAGSDAVILPAVPFTNSSMPASWWIVTVPWPATFFCSRSVNVCARPDSARQARIVITAANCFIYGSKKLRKAQPAEVGGRAVARPPSSGRQIVVISRRR